MQQAIYSLQTDNNITFRSFFPPSAITNTRQPSVHAKELRIEEDAKMVTSSFCNWEFFMSELEYE